MATFEWKLLILNRIIALRRFAEPFQNLSNHFKNARADRSMTIAWETRLLLIPSRLPSTHLIQLGVFLTPMDVGTHVVTIKGEIASTSILSVFGIGCITDDFSYSVKEV